MSEDSVSPPGCRDAPDGPRAGAGHDEPSTARVSRRSALVGFGGLLTLGSAGPFGRARSTARSARAGSAAASVAEGFDRTLTDDIWEIHYYDGFEDDATRVADWLALARETLTDDVYPHEYDRTTPVMLYRADEHDTWRTNAGHWWNGDGTIARSRMEMVTPSEHDLSGDRRDRWYASAVAHEYVHLPQLRDYRREFDAPDWFTEGMPEYLANLHVLPAAGYGPAEETDVDPHIERGDGYSFIVGNWTYPGGQRLFQFLADEYGPPAVTELTRSDEPSLARALERDLGFAPVEFEGRWLEWAMENVGGDYDFPDSSTDAALDSSADATLDSSADAAPDSPLDTTPDARSPVRPSASPIGTERVRRAGGSVDESANRRRPDRGETATVAERVRGGPDARLRSGGATGANRASEEAFADTVSTAFFTVHHHDGFRADAERVVGWLDSIAAAYDELHDHPDLRTEVYLYRNTEYSPWSLGATPGETMEMVTPSDHEYSGTRRDEWYVENIAQQYVGGLVEAALPDAIFAPDWLTLGVGNYVARRRAGDDLAFSRQRTAFERLVDEGSAHVLQVAGGYYEFEGWFAEALLDATDGAFLRDVLTADAPTLAERVETAGIHPYHVEPTYLRWLSREFDAGYDVPASRGRTDDPSGSRQSERTATETAAPTDTETESPAGPETTIGTNDGSPGIGSTTLSRTIAPPTGETRVEQPGFGVMATLASVVGAGFLLDRRLNSGGDE